MMPDDDNDNSFPFEIVDPTILTASDWAEVNKLKQAWHEGGTKELKRAMSLLKQGDPMRTIRIYGAFFPREVADVIKDHLADVGVTEEDVRVKMQEFENAERRKH
jgi:hypothetical protein